MSWGKAPGPVFSWTSSGQILRRSRPTGNGQCAVPALGLCSPGSCCCGEKQSLRPTELTLKLTVTLRSSRHPSHSADAPSGGVHGPIPAAGSRGSGRSRRQGCRREELSVVQGHRSELCHHLHSTRTTVCNQGLELPLPCLSFTSVENSHLQDLAWSLGTQRLNTRLWDPGSQIQSVTKGRVTAVGSRGKGDHFGHCYHGRLLRRGGI